MSHTRQLACARISRAGCSLIYCLSMFGCGSDDASERGSSLAEDTVNPPPAGDGVVELELQSGEVAPGEELIVCEYLAPLNEDMFLSRLDTYQGSGGHHLVFYRWLGEQRPAGTIEDCADGASMSQMMLVATPIVSPKDSNAYVEFPEGSALLVESGTQLVAQYHYINATSDMLGFRDVAHIKTVPSEAVERVVYTFALGSIDFKVPPNDATTDAFECEIPYDMNPLLTFPHMHEYGAKFWADVGADGEFEPIIDVTEWSVDMRDVPPITNYLSMPASEQPVFRRGEKIRTYCTWENPTAKEIGFPNEMCATVGYFSSDDPAADNVLCGGSTKIAPEP